MPISNSDTRRAGRASYFADHGLPADGGYDDRFVVFKFRGIPVFAFPNTADRKHAVRYQLSDLGNYINKQRQTKRGFF